MTKKFFNQPVLVFSFLIIFILAGTEAPIWISAFAALMVLWKLAAEKALIPPISRTITGVLSVLVATQVYIQNQTFFGAESSSTMLIGLAALKIMDYQNQRDHRFLILLGLIMASLKALATIDFYWAIPSGIAFVGLWYSMLSPQFPKKPQFLARVFVASVPMALILFFVFPRFVVPWAMARAANRGAIGFSDSMNPGSIAGLAGNDVLAFRATFVTDGQELENLYWRGAVLTRSEGLSWRRPERGRSEAPSSSAKGVALEYEVVLEPNRAGYLFTLDFPVEVRSEGGRFEELGHGVYQSFENLKSTKVYQAVSRLGGADTSTPRESLSHTPELSPRARAWVNEVIKRNESEAGRLEELKRFFQDPEFVYTLNPGRYNGDDRLDTFLFERRQGFCEHFAGAYATLARALGIPSRVVVGYHGGKFNLYGDFWSISQGDAHAWVEVFYKDRWQRVDPTAWVAPLRLEMGAQAFFDLSEDEQRGLVGVGDRGGRESIINTLSLWVEHLNYRWSYFLLGFDRETQTGFWMKLKGQLGSFIAGAILLLVLSVLLFRAALAPKNLRRGTERLLGEVIIWGQKQGVNLKTGESPLVHLGQLQAQFPGQAEVIDDIAKAYDQEVYQESVLEQSRLLELKRRWRRRRKE